MLFAFDLLLFGDLIIAHSNGDKEPPSGPQTGIVVPNPRMHERRFVLEPLCEIAPEIRHPVLERREARSSLRSMTLQL